MSIKHIEQSSPQLFVNAVTAYLNAAKIVESAMTSLHGTSVNVMVTSAQYVTLEQPDVVQKDLEKRFNAKFKVLDDHTTVAREVWIGHVKFAKVIINSNWNRTFISFNLV